MHSFVCQSSYFKITILKVGDGTFHPSIKDLENIKEYLEKDTSLISSINDWCKIPLEVQIIPESSNDKEYVYYCTSDDDYFRPSDDDIKNYQECFKEGLYDNNFIIYTYYPIDIKRISKALLPFI